MKKIILIVGLVFSLGYATPSGTHSTNNGASQTVPVGNKDKKPVSLKEMLNGFINSLQVLRGKQDDLKKNYDKFSESLETVTTDLSSIINLIEVNKKSIKGFKKVYDNSIEVCSNLIQSYQEQCKDEAKQTYDSQLGSINGLQQLLDSLGDKLKSAKSELTAKKAMTGNKRDAIKYEIEVLENRINAIKGN